MTTYTNFDSFNGWVMPGSGKQVFFDGQDYYIDENGDIWVPCFDCQTGTERRNAHIMEGKNPEGG